MKIIQVDNYCRDSVADVLIAENVNEYFGNIIVDLLNEKQTNQYFILENDDYRLSKGLEDLI